MRTYGNKKLAIILLVIELFAMIVMPVSIFAEEEEVFAKKLSELISDKSVKLNPRLQWMEDDLREFYYKNNFETVWFDEDGNVQKNFDDFVIVILSSEVEGLEPEKYKVREILDASINISDARNIIANELRLTNLVMNFIKDLKLGNIDPSANFPSLKSELRVNKISDDFREVIENIENKVMHTDAFLKKFAPKHPEYVRLRSHLAKFREKAKNENWEKIPEGKFIRWYNKDPRMPIIRKRLEQQGWIITEDKKLPHGFAGPELPTNFKKQLQGEDASALNDSEAQNTKEKKQAEEKRRALELKHDDDTIATIKRFQAHRGTKIDGVIGPETIAALNVSYEDRIKQIKYSMERWRWLPENLGDKYIFVNIAGFYAHAVEDGEIVVNTPIIVGERAHQTPALSSHMRNVKFFPDWGVPYSIAKRYLIAKIQKNPEVVYNLGYEVYKNGQRLDWMEVDFDQLNPSEYKFRQRPGRLNALGLVRFTIENSNSIYLHDTSDASLFQEADRAFSSGCVRVAKPVDLAKFVLVGNSSMSVEQVEEKFDSAKILPKVKTQIIPLENRIPVYMTYMTAWVDSIGEIHFEDDIYNKDAQLERLLQNNE